MESKRIKWSRGVMYLMMILGELYAYYYGEDYRPCLWSALVVLTYPLVGMFWDYEELVSNKVEMSRLMLEANRKELAKR